MKQFLSRSATCILALGLSFWLSSVRVYANADNEPVPGGDNTETVLLMEDSQETFNDASEENGGEREEDAESDKKSEEQKSDTDSETAVTPSDTQTPVIVNNTGESGTNAEPGSDSAVADQPGSSKTEEQKKETDPVTENDSSDNDESASVTSELTPADEPAYKLPDLIEGVAYMPFSGTDYPVRYLYSDSYFSGSSAGDFNYELAAVSSILSNASAISRRSVDYPDEGVDDETRYKEQTKNIQTMLRELGFENIQYNEDYEKSGTPFTTGILCATKKITVDGKEYTLLGIYPRSFGYTLEWANNGEFGDSGDAQGPALNVTEKILPFVKDYLINNGVSGDLKIWSTGMSRGGGMAMLTTAYIDDTLGETGATNSLYGIEGLSITKDDIYTYAFGTPNWGHISNTRVDSEDPESEKKDIYNNIHNFAAEYDLLYKMLTGSWGLEHYGQDEIMTTDVAKKKLSEMMQEYVTLLGKENNEGLVDTNFFYKDEETGKIVYKPLEPEKTYQYEGQDMDLAEFLDTYMKNMTAGVNRETAYAANQEGMLALLSVFLGQRNKTGEIVKYIPEAAGKTFEEILQHAADIYIDEAGTYETPAERIDAGIAYIKQQLALDNLTAGILTNAFDQAGVLYKYDFFERDDADDSEVQELYRQYIDRVFNLLTIIALADPAGLAPMYQASSNLWPAHDSSVYAAWLNTFSSENEYLLKRLTDAEKWGYRMVYLPDEVVKEDGTLTIDVYRSAEDYGEGVLDGVIRNGKYYRADGTFDPYVHIGADLNRHKVLYLRSDQKYVLVMNPSENQTSTDGLTVDEFEYEDSYRIFDPLHTIEKDDHAIDLTQILGMINDGSYTLSDRLIFRIGGIEIETDTRRLMQAAGMGEADAGTADNDHEAEYYLLSKLIELGGAVEGRKGGKVNSLDYSLLKLLLDSTGNPITGTLNASPLSGYRFVGWYTPDGKFVSDLKSLTRTFTFADTSMLFYARFEKICDDDDSKTTPIIIPTDGWNEINIPVEVEHTGQIARIRRIPNTADDSLAHLWMMFLASLTAAGASLFLLKERS